MTPTNVVFDIGGVLVEWDPRLAWSDHFATMEATEAFLARTSFREKNARADGGARFADLAAEIGDSADRALFAEYVQRFARTVETAIPGTWAILDRLKDGGTPIHAITNWSAEAWPEGLKIHPRLGEVFETLVVSGREHIQKPDRRIYALLAERAGVEPAECVFIDDAPHNVEGAQAAGMDAIHFTSPAALEAALIERGLL